jgi:hypothetical protein
MLSQIGGEQSRRSSARRLLLALAGLVVLGGAVIDGAATDIDLVKDHIHKGGRT